MMFFGNFFVSANDWLVVWLGGLDSWDPVKDRIIAKVSVPWESQSTNPDPNHQFIMSWLLFFFPNGFGSWFPVCCDYQKPTVEAETPKDMSPFCHCKNYKCHNNHQTSSNKTSKMCRGRWFQLFQCGKKKELEQTEATLSSHASDPFESYKPQPEIARWNERNSSDRTPQVMRCPGCANKCDTPSRPGCFWRIWMYI